MSSKFGSIGGLVVATATAGFGLTQLGSWMGLTGAGMMLLATAGALARRRTGSKCRRHKHHGC